jgi:hypothetical protein
MNDELLSRALDEIYLLRLLLASEARILEAHLDYKSFPKSRRRFAEESVERMRDAVRGEAAKAVRDVSRNAHVDTAKREYKNVYGSQTLTLSQWVAEKH